MGEDEAKRPGPGAPGGRVASIVERIEQKKMAQLRAQSARLHVREIEAAVEWLDMKKQLEAMDLDAEIARPYRGDAEEGRREQGLLRCLRGLQRCLRGDVAGGQAEWDEVSAEVPDLALPHLFWARWLVQRDPRGALAHFERAAELDPRDANTYWRRGDCYTKLGDHDRAVANYRRAVAIDPHAIDGLHALGKALIGLGKPDEALRYLDDAIARAPRYVDFYTTRAMAHEVLEDQAAALRDYDRILALDPRNAVARFARAQCRAEVGDVDRALTELTALAAEEPDIAILHLARGKLLCKQERFDEALVALSRALDLAPDDHEALGYRSIVLMRIGEKARALADVTRAVEIAPDRPEYLFFLLTMRHEDDEDAKIAALAAPIERFPDAPMFLEERAALLNRDGLHLLALLDLDRLVARWPDDAGYHASRARTLGAAGRFEEALEAAERLIALDPDHAAAHAMRAFYRERLEGDPALVAADWDRAVALDPDDTETRYHRGEYRMRLDQHAAAVADFDIVIAARPDFGEAYYDRGLARAAIDDDPAEDDGDWEAAEVAADARHTACVADFERALALGHVDADVFADLHWAHRELGDYDAARAALDRGIGAFPESALLFAFRRALRQETNDLEGAAADQLRLTALMADELAAAEEAETPDPDQEAPAPDEPRDGATASDIEPF